MCDADLMDIGVTVADDRCRLLAAVSRLPSSLHCTRESLVSVSESLVTAVSYTHLTLPTKRIV